MIFDFSREAPGRSTNKAASTMTMASHLRPLEDKNFTLSSRKFRGSSPHDPEGSFPECLVEEVEYFVAQQELDVIAEVLAVFVFRRRKRPVNEHGTPNNVLLRNEPPIPAVQAHSAMIAHGKVMVRRH